MIELFLYSIYLVSGEFFVYILFLFLWFSEVVFLCGLFAFCEDFLEI